MKLKSITVGGFKNLKKSTIYTDGVVSLVSPNNYGKSNLLEAIDFGVSFMFASPKTRNKRMGSASCIPINRTLANEDFYFEIEFDDASLGEYRFVKYGYSFSWYKDDNSGRRVTDEWLEMRENESVRYTAYIKRPEGKYRKTKSTTSFRKINVDDNQLVIDLLTSVQELDIKAVIESIRKMEYHICSSLDLGDRFQPVPLEYIDNKNESGVAFDDNDLPRALYQLKKCDINKYDLFLEAVYSLFEEFVNVEVQSYELKKEDSQFDFIKSDPDGNLKITDSDGTESTIPFRLRDEMYKLMITNRHLNQPISMSMMSTGTKRIFWLLANAFIASSKKISCIGIEELETSIHPKLLRSLLEILDETINDTSLIISSHSPYLIQYLKPEKIYVGVPNDDGIAEFRRVRPTAKKRLVQFARDNGMSVGDYLFELMTGDDDSSRILRLYLED